MKMNIMHYLSGLVATYIPRHGKRLLALVIYYLINYENKSLTKQLHDLIAVNRKMTFSQSETAIRFALEFGRLMLTIGLPIIGSKENWHTPEWLRYDPQYRMADDYQTLKEMMSS